MLAKKIRSPLAEELDVLSQTKIKVPSMFEEPDAPERLYIVDIRFSEGKLTLHYHKMLEAQCRLDDTIMLKHLEWVHSYLQNSGFIMAGIKGVEHLAGIFIEPGDEFEYAFIASVNMQILSETEGMDISSYFIEYFRRRRSEKMAAEGKEKLHGH